MIYHITSEIAWNAAKKAGSYRGDTLASDGFIHTSTIGQVNKTANRFYFAQKGLVLLEIDESRLLAEVKYEPAENGELFPHIFGEVNLDAVRTVYPFSPKEDGAFIFCLPENKPPEVGSK